MKSKKKRIIISVVSALLALALLTGGIFLLIKIKKKTNIYDNYFNQAALTDDDMVMATGVVSIGTVEETLDISNMENTLEITETLFSNGDEIKEGDPLLTFTEDSVEKAKEELEENLREKELAYRAGKIEYEQTLISAQHSYQSTILKGQQADEIYNEAVAGYKDTLEAAEETYNDSVELLEEYKDAQANNSYYTKYKVEYYQKVYEENKQLLMDKSEEWGVPLAEATGKGARLGPDEYSQYKYILQSLYAVIEDNAKNYNNALESYNNDQEDLSYNLLSLELNMSTIEETYTNAKKSYELNLLNAEKTRQTAKTNAELAESDYNAKVEKAEADFDTLESEYEDAVEDYDTFTQRIVNNQYLAENSGTVMRSAIRGSDNLSAGSKIVMYSDMSEILVTVSVDQSDIAKLAVGDSAICYSSDTGMINASIKSISPITESTSISSVYYTVTVQIDSEINSLSNNSSVTVVFGYDIDSAAGIESMLNSQTTEENSENNMPDFSNMDMSNFPDINNMPAMPENMPSMPGN